MSLKKEADGTFVMADDGKLESCLTDEFLEIKHLRVPLYKPQVSDTQPREVLDNVDFYVRPLTDPERSKLAQKSSSGDVTMMSEATEAALETYCKMKFPNGSKKPGDLNSQQIAEAGKLYGKQGVSTNIDMTKYNALLIYFALGGERVIGKGELGVGREGWTLKDRGGNVLPVQPPVIEARLNNRVKNALVELVLSFDGVEIASAAAKN